MNSKPKCYKDCHAYSFILVIESPSFSYQMLYQFIPCLMSGSFKAFLITHSSERNDFLEASSSF
jgi:hypothetical protein